MIKLFVAGEVYPKRQHIFPLLKPFEKKESFTDAQRMSLYNISENDVHFAEVMQDADFVLLPMSWNFYRSENKMATAKQIIAQASTVNKKVLSFMVGDFGVGIPDFENVIVFRHSGNRAWLPETHVGMPAFVEDPMQKIFKTEGYFNRVYNHTPVVGFCGQANASMLNAAKELLHTAARNVRSRLGMSRGQAQQLLSTSYLRAAILRTLEKTSTVTTNFIYRKQYRAGATTPEMRAKTTLEFYENMRDSDYVVCVRGAGNFSVRFYETLAMGRIPVFVNTDCLLPLAETIPWKKQVVWVDYKDLNRVGEKVAAFHESLSAQQFEDLLAENRALWKEKLTLGGFFKTYFNTPH